MVADEGDGAVFHLGGGVAFGMDVGDFFKLQGAFEGDGEEGEAAEEEEVLMLGEAERDFADTGGEFEGAASEVGEGF
jgi:hypothetical protein